MPVLNVDEKTWGALKILKSQTKQKLGVLAKNAVQVYLQSLERIEPESKPEVKK